MATQTIYRGKKITLELESISLPGHRTTQKEIVRHPGAVVIIPWVDDQRICMVRNYRYTIKETLLELPAGTLHPGEEAEACAARELREEIGMAAGRLVKLGGVFLAPGYSQEYLHVFLASALTPSPLPRDADEAITVEAIPVPEAQAMACDGRIADAKSLASLLLAGPYLADFSGRG